MLDYGATPGELDGGGRRRRGGACASIGRAADGGGDDGSPSACSATSGWGSRATAPTAGTRWSRARSASARCPGRRGSAARTRSSRPKAHLERTAHFWRTWLAEGTYPDHPWRFHLQRSALALKGLTFMPTGRARRRAHDLAAGDAAGRTQLGLPLLLDARRVLHALGPARARPRTGRPTTSSSTWPTWSATRTARCRSCTGSGARRTSRSRTLDHLKGYEGARPVRDRQRRLLTSARTTSTARCSTRSTCTPRSATTSPSGCGRCSTTRSNAPAKVWREPDQGIWEARGEPRHYVSSKLMCWVALDRGARLAERRGHGGSGRRLAGARGRDPGRHPREGRRQRGVFRQHYETDALDASTLLVPLVRFLPPDDERVRATVMAISEELTEDGLVLRYRTDATDDGLQRGGGDVPDLLVLARLGAVGDRRAPRGRAPVRAAALLRLAARPLRRGARGLLGPAPRQLPAGLHAPRADQRGHPRDRAQGRASARRAQRRTAGRVWSAWEHLFMALPRTKQLVCLDCQQLFIATVVSERQGRELILQTTPCPELRRRRRAA